METILVVDDDRQILEIIKCILKREGVATHCVSSGEDALKEIREEPFL
jgi:CheY-like chemotaxis protein